LVPRNGFHRDAAFGIFTVTKCSPFKSLLFIANWQHRHRRRYLNAVALFFAFYYGVLADITGVHSTDVNCGHWRGHRELTFRPICRPSLFENAAPCMNGRFGEATLQRSAVKRKVGKGRLKQAGSSAPARCCITAFGNLGSKQTCGNAA